MNTKVRLLCTFLVVGLGVTRTAAAQEGGQRATVPYSGVLEDNGNTSPSGEYRMNFALVSCSQGNCSDQSPVVWVAQGLSSEWPQDPAAFGVPVQVYSGRFAIELGGPQTMPIGDRVFLDNPWLFLEVAVFRGETPVLLSGRQRLVPAPQAVRADALPPGNDVAVSGSAAVSFVGDASLGDGGRALSMGSNDTLVINSGGQFGGGVRIDGNVEAGGLRSGYARLDYIDAQQVSAQQVSTNYLSVTEPFGQAGNFERQDTSGAISTGTIHFEPPLEVTARVKGTAVPVPYQRFHELCGDDDGCEARMAVRGEEGSDYDPGLFVSHIGYNYQFDRWRMTPQGNTGRDGRDGTQHLINLWDTCFLTDGVFVNSQDLGDTTFDFGVMLWGDHNPARVCILTLRD